MKKIKEAKKTTIFLIIILFVLISIFEIPRKAYNIIRLDYNNRLISSYDYCSERAVGFLIDIKKKYNIASPLKFIKYSGVRNPNWIFFDRSSKKKNNFYVLLNYNYENQIYLEKITDNKFKYNFSHRFNHRKYKKILISKKNLNVNDINLKILRNNIEIFKNNFSMNDIFSGSNYLEIEIADNLNRILQENQNNEKDLIFQFENISEDAKIKINIEHIYDLSSFEVLENINTCYLVKFND